MTRSCCLLFSVPKCVHCGDSARCNISHFPDDPADIDGSIKNCQRHNFKKWLRNLRCKVMAPGGDRKAKKRKVSSDHTETYCPRRVLVLEVGSGDSQHGLRGESELLLSAHPDVGFGAEASFVRINPDGGHVPLFSSNKNKRNSQLRNTAIIKLGALAAFQKLLQCAVEENVGI